MVRVVWYKTNLSFLTNIFVQNYCFTDFIGKLIVIEFRNNFENVLLNK